MSAGGKNSLFSCLTAFITGLSLHMIITPTVTCQRRLKRARALASGPGPGGHSWPCP